MKLLGLADNCFFIFSKNRIFYQKNKLSESYLNRLSEDPFGRQVARIIEQGIFNYMEADGDRLFGQSAKHKLRGRDPNSFLALMKYAKRNK